MATLDQRRDALDPDMSVRDTLTGGRGDQVFVGGQSRHVVGYMRDFLFTPEQAGTPVAALSGGERGRLTLARALARPSNLLVLDEPTNDLDLETLDLLEEMIDDYPGPCCSSRTIATSSTARCPRWWLPKAVGAGMHTPAAIPTWWRSAAKV
jgi:ATP-binding cassette subfamily F protein uup